MSTTLTDARLKEIVDGFVGDFSSEASVRETYSKSALYAVRDLLLEHKVEDPTLTRSFGEIESDVHNLAENQNVINVSNAIDDALKNAGYQKSDLGFWHQPADPDQVQAAQDYEAKVRADFAGRVFSNGQESEIPFVSGKDFVEQYQSYGEMPSSPYEALDFFLDDPNVNYYGAHECDWGDVVDAFQRWLNENKDQVEDCNGAGEALTCAKLGVSYEDFPDDPADSWRERLDRTFAECREDSMGMEP